MKNIISILILWMSAFTVGNGQVFEVLNDATGYSYSEEEIDSLEAATQRIIDVLPLEYKNQFKVFDFGYYVYNELMVGGSPAIWEKAKLDASSKSNFYLLFGREEDNSGNFNTIRIELKLPASGPFQCATETYIQVMKNMVASPLKSLENSLVGYAEAEYNSINNLKTYITKLTSCCSTGNWNANCGSCIYDYNEVKEFFRVKGYTRLNANQVSLEDFTYNSILSNKKILLHLDDQIFDFTGHLETLSQNNSGLTEIQVREYNETNCNELADFESLRTTSTYSEDVIILNYNNNVEVFTKFDFDNSGNRFLPWLAVEALKRIAMAALGGVVEVSFQTMIEWYVGPHTSFSNAWDAVDIDWWEVAASSAEGAFSEAKYASIIIQAFKSVVTWIINTPYDAYFHVPNGGSNRGPGWITELSKQLIKAFSTAVLEELVLKKAGDVVKSITKHAPDLSAHHKSKLYKVVGNLASSYDGLDVLKNWKQFLPLYKGFNSNSNLLVDGTYLKKVMDATKNGDPWKIIGQKLGYSHHPASNLAENITKFNGRAKKANEVAHHIVAGGSKYKNAQNSLDKIKKLGVDVNEGANGVFMPKSSKYVNGTTPAHSKIHTHKYYDEVFARIEFVNDPIELREILDEIRQEIIDGTFPYN